MKTMRWLVGLAAISTAVACGSAPVDVGQTDPESSDEALSKSWQKLVGAFEGQGGSIGAIVFTSETGNGGHTFFADVDNGIRCIKAPCPSTSRIEGWYTAGTKYVTLHVTKTVGHTTATDYSGKYAWSFKYLNGRYLQLSKGQDSQSLKDVGTYCQAAEDCADQDFVHVMCVGHFTCNQNRCGYSCGWNPPPSGVKCGSKTCGAGDYCCNPVMSICAPKGAFCIQ